MFPKELTIPRSVLLAQHPYFEEFPEMRKPFTTQLNYWALRLLMTEQNARAKPEFTLNFLQTEDDERVQALVSPEYPGHAKDEAADVVVVSFIAPAFWSSEMWKTEGESVIRYVSLALEQSGM